MVTSTGGPDGAGARPPRPLTRTRGRHRTAALPLALLAVLPLAACTPTNSSSSTKTSSKTVVVIRTSDDTCWQATVDGRKRKGCGDADLTDRHGNGSAKVVKTKGDSRVRVRLVVGGHTVDRVSVRDADAWVVVESSDG